MNFFKSIVSRIRSTPSESSPEQSKTVLKNSQISPNCDMSTDSLSKLPDVSGGPPEIARRVILNKSLGPSKEVMTNNPHTNSKFWENIVTDRIRNSVDQFDLSNRNKTSPEVKSIKIFDYQENVKAQYTSHIDPFFQAYRTAYNNHDGLIISPDDIWTMVLLNFSVYVNANSEALRKSFVDFKNSSGDFKDKKELYFESLIYNTNEFVTSMVTQIEKNSKLNLDKMTNNFSTSNQVEKMVSYIGVMSAMKPYFSYTFELGCGLSHVEFLGTLDDYDKLIEKINGLKKYDVKNQTSSRWYKYKQWSTYIEGVEKIVINFKKTYEQGSNIDRSLKRWWQEIMDQYYYQGYGGGESSLTGWITDLYLEKKFRTERDIPNLYFNADVKSDTMGDFEMVAGFSGIYHDEKNKSYRPQMSYCVLQPVIQ